jgi:hypothetical protein
MTAGLGSLIRLRRWRLDEERRLLAEKLRGLEALLSDLAALDAEIDGEQRTVRAADPELSFAYAPFACRTSACRAAATAAIDRTEADAAAQRAQVLACHQELRSAELAEEARCRKLAAEAERRDRIALDELALLARQYQK